MSLATTLEAMDSLPIALSPTTAGPTTAIPSSPTTMVTPEEEAFPIPELNDSEYAAQVLHLTADKSEAQIDNELVARAAAIGLSATLPSAAGRRHTASALSYSTFAAYGDRSFSTVSTGSYSTILTPQSSVHGLPSPIIGSSEFDDEREDDKSLTFSRYEHYLAAMDASPDQPKFLSAPPVIDGTGTSPSVFSVSTKKSFSSVRTGLKTKMRWRKRGTQPLDPSVFVTVNPPKRGSSSRSSVMVSSQANPKPSNSSCIACRDDFSKAGRLHSLQCGHTHCTTCLSSLVVQASSHEAKMPPRCCSQAIPASTVKAVLSPDDQITFLLAVVKFSTPWLERIYCPDAKCKEFVPYQDVLDPKHPFDLACLKCHGRMCGTCKEIAHPIGQDCPMDWELAAVKNTADFSSTWRRCHCCRSLVEEETGESPNMTCRCRASWCTLCGGIWDPTTGCPNLCNFEEDLERRRQEAQDRPMPEEEEEQEEEEEETCEADADQLRAESALEELGLEQQEEMQRFIEYMARAEDQLRKRHARQKGTILEKYENQEERLRETHEKSSSQLEDRQIAAELELRTSLEQSERSVKLRLKHMEAYCEGLGRSPTTAQPNRIVTERDLRELGQQYNLRDDMDRMHQSRINVMRDRQAKQMEELIEKQETELDTLSDRRQAELDKIGEKFTQEQALVEDVFRLRRARMHPRWVLAIEVLCKELEEQTGQPVKRIAPPKWPREEKIEEEEERAEEEDEEEHEFGEEDEDEEDEADERLETVSESDDVPLLEC